MQEGYPQGKKAFFGGQRNCASCASHALQFSRLCYVIRICGVAVLLCPNFVLHDPCEK